MNQEKGSRPLRYGFWGYLLLIIGLAGVSALLLIVFQRQLVDRGVLISTAWLIWGGIFSALLMGLIGMAFWWRWKQSIRQIAFKPKLPTKQETEAINKTSSNSNLTSDIKTSLQQQYGHFWPRKVRILLLTGSAADVEQLTPGLTSQYWQEDSGTVLLWGGELGAQADSAWLGALRKLRRRPLDGVVWVTSALARSPQLGQENGKTTLSTDMMDSVAQAFASRYALLGWRLPLYVWSLHADDGAERITQSVGCLLPAGCKADELRAQLVGLVPSLIEQGTQQISSNTQHPFLLQLADQLARQPDSVVAPLATLLNPYRPSPLAGIIFSPTSVNAKRSVKHHWGKDNRWDVLIDSLSSLPTGLAAKKLGFAWRKTLGMTVAGIMVLWGAGMVMSFLVNRDTINTSDSQVKLAANVQQPLPARLQAQLELQHTLDRLQYRQRQGAPWFSRFGLSQNDALLAALWPHYQASATPLLRDAAARHLEEQLNTMAQLPPDSPLRDTLVKPAYDQLKLYLMLARPEKMDAAWFSTTLLRDWPQRNGVPDSTWQGIGPALLDFYARNLSLHPAWRLKLDENLVHQVRTRLISQMGARNSESSLYQKMLAQVAHQYADLRLSDMTGDTDAERIFTTDAVVPGMFTRKAWDDAVKPAIEKVVSERREEMDWVLSDSKNAVLQQDSPEALQARLKARYFADFSTSWLDFLNSLHWQQAQTLSDSIDQLTLMADVRQSPLVALMNTLSIQGKTGQTGEALSDSLVKSAKNLLNREDQPAIDQQAGAQGPLDATFGPVLALMDIKGGQGTTNLSLPTFLTRVTQVRLKLQQVVNAADPQAMTQTLAQTVFQGKAVDLTETRDYGSLVAASLGQEWSGFGQTVFVQPMEQAWQQVLTPAAQSLNAQWQASIVDDWNSTFGGRYPLKNTSSEVSLPLLARYLNSDSGRIARFLQTRLNGVLHKEGSHWVPDSINAQGLTFNPAFLKAVDQLSYLSDIVFADGEAGIRFELRPGTAKDVMQTDLVIDSQKLSYYNQLPVWKRFIWPNDTEAPGASLSWISTQAGTRQFADHPGAWGWIRLLEKAQVTPYQGVNSSFNLTWKAPDGRPLNYTLRTEAGDGPLALLKLRNFVLPAQIFSVDATNSVQRPDTTTGEGD
ncbi:ImcF domain-containing protein [Yersinia frederiksenii]|uniref:ImcF domain-containing protein n=3 Tax=Yersinia frederiksenii TaxID=29484 RepID=A0A380PTN5_YERFR|nr:ImcF-related family protein [Yersinia frederiksenii]ATM94513.1 type VI secretion protein VasK [Yersinia frederiksenii]KGA48858.1 intracellular multiplication and macrophage-killing family protein [Yersinia frederiksenii ATCC 33641]SUP76984.1 ImcF domain-containing protein [Yersinia frederiksenii]